MVSRVLKLFVTVFVVVAAQILKLYEKIVRPWRRQKDISGKVVVLTGAGGGIGRELAKRLAHNGCVLALWDIATTNNEATARMCHEMGVKAHAYTVDISDRQQVYATAKRVREDLGPVDILVSNAGVINFTPFLQSDDEKMSRLIDVNAKSLMWAAKAFVPDMLERGSGHLVCVSSVAGVIGSPLLVDYSMSKFAASGFMEALQHQLGDQGYNCINFTTFCPIYIRTPLLDTCEYAEQLHPLLEPDFVADEIVYALRTNARLVILPKTARVIYALRGIISWEMFQSLILSRHRKKADGQKSAKRQEEQRNLSE
ncbi:short-chain dehydrogenase/reductase family 16C member 6-like protein [Aphelenchoides avenae]|nr:short-chain dehydrogenase/reductase family 16C member 6-like protein [Aphelenchus avenae]